MVNLNEYHIVKHHKFYHRMLFGLILIATLCSRLLGFIEDNGRVIIFLLIIALMWGLEFVFAKLNYFDSDNFGISFKYIELILFNILQANSTSNLILLALLCIMTTVLSVEFSVLATDYDKSTAFVRRIMLGVALAINVGTAFSKTSEANWLCYVLLQIFALLAVFFITDWLITLNSECEIKTNKLLVEKNDIESSNEKLREYKDKVKEVNERINYQKIDLARTLKELEQINAEVESQTELMKYMASTFDIVKCSEVLTDAVADIKKTKLCALFIDKNVYMNREPGLIVKTNYTSLERRLKKSIYGLYSDLKAKGHDEPAIYRGSDVRRFEFLGDVNINSLAVMPLIGDSGMYGVMIAGSDNESFFDKGLTYYESCIVEFGVAVKSTNLYLKTQDIARKDGLTGIYNRLYFNELFVKACDEAVAAGKPISVALFDIDKFKNVNDTYGHLMGDEVIKMVAHIDADYAEENGGFACRYGGEEFLLVLPGYDSKQMLPVLERMHESIKSTVVKYNGMEISINVCIGFSTYPDICGDVNILVSRADKAMYYGKKNGRGRLVMDNPQIDNMNT